MRRTNNYDVDNDQKLLCCVQLIQARTRKSFAHDATGKEGIGVFIHVKRDKSAEI